MSDQEKQLGTQLGAIFNELIDLIGEAKQAIWASSATGQRAALEALKAYLGEQAGRVDDAEISLGGRPAWVLSPTGHHPRNLAAAAGGDPNRFIDVLAADLETLVEDIRLQSGSTEGDWTVFLTELADGLETRVRLLTRSQ